MAQQLGYLNRFRHNSIPQSFPLTSVGQRLGDPPFFCTSKQLKWLVVLTLTAYVIGVFQHLNPGRKCAFLLSLVPSVLIPASLFRVFLCYPHLLKAQSSRPEVWPVMKVLMASGNMNSGNFVFWKLRIENMFGKIDVYDRVNLTFNLQWIGWVENCLYR